MSKLTPLFSVPILFGGRLVTKSCPTLVTPWTVACQAPLSVGFQGIFPTQESNPGLLHCRWILYQPIYKGSCPFFITPLKKKPCQAPMLEIHLLAYTTLYYFWSSSHFPASVFFTKSFRLLPLLTSYQNKQEPMHSKENLVFISFLLTKIIY